MYVESFLCMCVFIHFSVCVYVQLTVCFCAPSSSTHIHVQICPVCAFIRTPAEYMLCLHLCVFAETPKSVVCCVSKCVCFSFPLCED